LSHLFSQKRWAPKGIVILLLIIAIGLSATKQLEISTQAAGLNTLSTSNQEYLDSALKRTLQTFALLSAVKVGLAIIEGTEVGVGFGIEIGDVVQAAYDYVDLAWRVVLTSAAILIGTRFLLQAAGLVDHWLLSVTLFFILLALFMRWTNSRRHTIHRILQDITLVSVILTLTLYLVLPLSIMGGRLLSSKITRPSIEEAEQGVSRFKADIFPDGNENQSGFWSRFGNPQAQVKAIAKTISQKTTELSLWILKIIAGYLFDTLIFPLLLFLIGIWLTKSATKYLYSLNRESFLFQNMNRG